MRLSNGVGDEEGFLTLMDLDKPLSYYKLASMVTMVTEVWLINKDILEFKAISLYEFAFLTSGTAIDHPDSLALPENLKINELVLKIKSNKRGKKIVIFIRLCGKRNTSFAK